MNEEERYIADTAGRSNPFLVPDGYFDSLADQIMSSLPERKPRARSLWLRPWLYAAASVLVLVVSVALWKALPETTTHELQVAEVRQDSSDAFFDEAADYMMLDNQDIYACLSDY